MAEGQEGRVGGMEMELCTSGDSAAKTGFLAGALGSRGQRVTMTLVMPGGHQAVPAAMGGSVDARLYVALGAWGERSEVQWTKRTLPGLPVACMMHSCAEPCPAAVPQGAITASQKDGEQQETQLSLERSPYEIPPSSCQQTPLGRLSRVPRSLSPCLIPEQKWEVPRAHSFCPSPAVGWAGWSPAEAGIWFPSFPPRSFFF